MTDNIPCLFTAPLQEIFDFVYEKLIEQGTPSIAETESDHILCQYRAGYRGLKCAIGHLIPDDKYDPEFESCRIGSVDLYGTWLDPNKFVSRLQFIKGLQACHDDAALWETEGRRFKSDFHFRMKSLADVHRLKFNHEGPK